MLEAVARLKRYYSRKRLALVLLLPVVPTLLLRGCVPAIYSPAYRPQTMKSIPSLRATHCVGRFLVDLPQGFELRSGGWGDIELYYGLDRNFKRVYGSIKKERYTPWEFWDAVNERRAELKHAKNGKTQGPMLLYEEQLNQAAALIRRLPDEESANSIKTEIHALVGPRYVVLEEESFDYTAEPNMRRMDYRNVDPSPADARLKTIVAKLKSYEVAENAFPGFCMQGVLFDVGQDDETAIFRFRSAAFGDVNVDVNYHAVTGQPSKGLIERSHDGANRWYSTFAGKIAVMRERQTSLGDGAAEESLIKTVQPVTQHIFDIERRSNEKRSLDNPYFGLKLTTGNEYDRPLAPDENPPVYSKLAYYDEQRKVVVHREGNASLSDEQVLKLWEGILASVRMRR